MNIKKPKFGALIPVVSTIVEIRGGTALAEIENAESAKNNDITFI